MTIDPIDTSGIFDAMARMIDFAMPFLVVLIGIGLGAFAFEKFMGAVATTHGDVGNDEREMIIGDLYGTSDQILSRQDAGRRLSSYDDLEDALSVLTDSPGTFLDADSVAVDRLLSDDYGADNHY
jgi:hypothetical protein